MHPVDMALIGAGHLGQYHLDKLLDTPSVHLRAVVDPDEKRREQAHQKLRVYGLEKKVCVVPHDTVIPRAVAGAIQAAVVACPTPLHEDIGLRCIAQGWHTLIEKPLAPTRAAAARLWQAALSANRLLQVGHLERFNPAVRRAIELAGDSHFIVAERLGPFSGRSPDIDVVFDLMVHDLDIVGACNASDLIETRALGVSVMTHAIDMASARLTFADGMVAQLAAGRASLEPCRKLRFFSNDRYISVDCLRSEIKSIRKNSAGHSSSSPMLEVEPENVIPHDNLAVQLQSFLRAITARDPIEVDGKAGLRAVEMAEAVCHEIARHQQLLQTQRAKPKNISPNHREGIASRQPLSQQQF